MRCLRGFAAPMNESERVAFLAAGVRLMFAASLRFQVGPDGSAWLAVADTCDRSWWSPWLYLRR